MSLINEALKKAQRQRTDAPVPQPAPAPVGTNEAPVARIAKRRPPMPARTLVILLGGSVSLLLMGGVFVFIFFLHGLDSAPEPKAPSSQLVANSSQLPAPSTPSVAIPSSPLPAPSSQPAATSPQLPANSSQLVQLPPIAVPAPPVQPLPAPSSQLSTLNSQPAVATSPQLPATSSVLPTLTPPPPAVSPPSSVLRPPPSTPTANSRVYEFLEKLRVSGIRASDTDPKVIMNDRVYRLNDIVDRLTQLRLTRIEASTLTFVDASGFEYRKSF